MRSLAHFSAALLLGVAMTACQNSGQESVIPGAVKSSAHRASGFDLTLKQAQSKLDALIDTPLTIPVPKDPGGGYTHETHKANFTLMYDAGQLYQLTGEKKYADFAGKMMLAYADVYPSWGIHLSLIHI